MNKLFAKSTTIFLSFLVLSAGLVAPVSYAQAGPTGPTSEVGGYVCDAAKYDILKTLDSYATSIVSTALTHSETLSAIKPFLMASGMSHAEMMGCMSYIATTVFPSSPAGNALISLGCAETDVRICQSLLNQFNVGSSTGSGFSPTKFAKGKVSGSLLGLTYFVQNTLEYEPVPVNMAYFFKDYAAKLPIVGETVYAQNTTDYGHTLINAVLNMWKVFRNIAYALMAVIMLWVGFAIITRRRISAQTVVNVQYALPKIVIALIFIALSYPVGALITSLSWTLFNSSTDIIVSITGQNISASSLGGGMSFIESLRASETLGAGGNAALIMLIMVAAAGSGALLSLLGFIFAIVVGFYLFAYIKAFWIYLKMVISTATSPLQIALYALPGNDDKLEMWLKQMVAWGAGIFGMALVFKLVIAFSLDLLLQAYVPIITGVSAGGAAGAAGAVGRELVSGSLFNVVIAPLMMIFGTITAIQIPNKIETMIMGPQKGGKR